MRDKAIFLAFLHADTCDDVLPMGPDSREVQEAVSWISKRFFRKRPSYEEEFASNLYDALVLGGGPSAEAEGHIDADVLDIPLNKLERFASKRLITLEAFLFVATSVGTMPKVQADGSLFKSVHPLAVQMGKHLQGKWAERGIKIADHYAVGERCFDEVSTALEKLFRWGRAWLDEFYDNPEKSGEYYILWTDQCLKEFETMKLVVAQNVH